MKERVDKGDSMSTDSFRTRAVKGVFWSIMGKGSDKIGSFVIMVILVRVLQPADFGLLAMGMIIINLFRMFVDQGLSTALIQKTDLSDDHLSSAFWFGIALGLACAAGGIVLSGTVASLFHEPRLKPIVACVSGCFVLIALTSTQQAIMERSLRFRELAIRTLAARLGGGAVGITAALCGLGVWSLVIQTLVSGTVGVLVLWSVSSWRPSFRISIRHWLELAGFGVTVMGAGLLVAFDTNFDNMLVGYRLGSLRLGYYVVAYRLAAMFVNHLLGSAANVLMPAFSLLQHDEDRLRRALARVFETIAFLAFPVYLGMAVLAREIVLTVCGARWEPSVPAVRTIAMAALAMSFTRPFPSAILAMGRPAWLLRIRVVTSFVRATAILVAVRWGIAAVGGALAMATWFGIPIYIAVVHRLTRFGVRNCIRGCAVPFLGAVVMSITVLALREVLGDSLSVQARLAACVLAGGAVYVFIIRVLRPTILENVWALLREAFAQKQGGREAATEKQAPRDIQ